MYLQYFGLTEAPFSITPDPAFVYLSQAHRDALAHLLYGVGQGGAGGFVQLTGEVGTGKTTICRCLLEQVPEDARIALILNPMVTPLELLATICQELDIPTEGITGSGKALVDRLNHYLLDQHAQGRRVVVVIDEAQNLSPEALEQVRLLTNLETAKHKLLQIVLLGQPELRRLLDRQDLRQLAQRVTARYHLAPLGEKETAAYVRHRMSVAGARQNPFTRRALRAIYRRSRGIPRLINIIADRALAGAYAREKTRIGVDLVNRAANEVQPSENRVTGGRWKWAVYVAVLAGGAVVAAAAWRPELLWRGMANPEEPREEVLLQAAPGPEAKPAETSPPTGKASPEVQEIVAAPTVPPPEVVAARTPGPATPNVEIEARPPVTSDEWLEEQDARAWRGLAELWRHPEEASALGSACAGQFGTGYGCVLDRGNWGRIRDLGLPVVMVLHQRGRHHVLLSRLEGDTLVLGTGSRQLEAPLETVEPLWFGEYYVAWPQAPDWPIEIHRGDSGAAVDIVMQMAALADPPWAGVHRFESEFESWLLDFQRRHGLVQDGIIGPKTLLYLMAPTIDQPRLALTGETG